MHVCVDDVLKTHGRIDLLVNNAGAGFLGTLEQTSDEAVRRTMDVNFFGVWRMTPGAQLGPPPISGPPRPLCSSPHPQQAF